MPKKDVEDLLNHIHEEFIIPSIKSKDFMDKYKLYSVISSLKSALDYTAQDLYSDINPAKK